MADVKLAENVEQQDVQVADVGTPNPPSLRVLADDLPEKDEVQKAVKAGMLADSAQQEAREKAKVVDASPNADETPSGYALKKVTGIAHDTKRGEEYLRHKTARRWGYVPADEA
jgi:hypothetical protein